MTNFISAFLMQELGATLALSMGEPKSPLHGLLTTWKLYPENYNRFLAIDKKALIAWGSLLSTAYATALVNPTILDIIQSNVTTNYWVVEALDFFIIYNILFLLQPATYVEKQLNSIIGTSAPKQSAI